MKINNILILLTLFFHLNLCTPSFQNPDDSLNNNVLLNKIVSSYMGQQYKINKALSEFKFACDEYHKSPPFSFTDNFDGTISMKEIIKPGCEYTPYNYKWSKCNLGESYANGSCTGTALTLKYCSTANRDCESNYTLSSGPSFAACNTYKSRSDDPSTWRMPIDFEISKLLTIKYQQEEAFGIYTYYKIDLNLFPSIKSGFYWSSSSNKDYKQYAIFIDLRTGQTPRYFGGQGDMGNKTNSYYIKCITEN
jgi:hypothetical protein